MIAAWTPAHQRYLLTETAIGVALTIALSCAFAWAVFGRSLPVAAGDPALQVDGALQALIVAFMSVLVPTLLTRKRCHAGAVTRCGEAHRWPLHAGLRALAIALAVAVPAALLHLALVPRLFSAFNLPELLLFKAAFGTTVALVATPLAVRLALADADAGSPARDCAGRLAGRAGAADARQSAAEARGLSGGVALWAG